MSAINIVKLFELYDLEVREVFDGNLQGDASSAPLPAEELYYIASTADKQDRMRTALVWFEELYKRVSEDRYPQSSIHLITVARGLAGVYNKVGSKGTTGTEENSQLSVLIAKIKGSNYFFLDWNAS